MSLHFSSKTNEWSTPQALFDKLNERFHFNLDPCASKENAKCKEYFTKEDDGLNQDWHGTVFMNPPYGREIGKWVKKAYEESKKGCKVVCLLPARTDTKWFHDYCYPDKWIEFIRGRIKFSGYKYNAPFPSMIVVFVPPIKKKKWPIALFNWIVRNYSKEDEVILDPFMGSGVTLEACKLLHRQYIGIEINPDYCKIAEERLSQEVFDFPL